MDRMETSLLDLSNYLVHPSRILLILSDLWFQGRVFSVTSVVRSGKRNLPSHSFVPREIGRKARPVPLKYLEKNS